MKTVTIPTIGSDPYKITINGYTYSYKAGSTVSVPDEVAAAIENAVRLFPAEVPPVDGSVFTLDGNAGTWDVAKGVDSAPAQGSEFTVASGGVWQAIEDAKVTDAQIKEAAEEVLEDHPEWTTTVEDGSITTAKLATGVIDATLAGAGMAADAKATGDEINALKTDVDELNEDVNGVVVKNYTEGKNFSANSTSHNIIDDSGACISDYIPITWGSSTVAFWYTDDAEDDKLYQIWFFDSSKEYLWYVGRNPVGANYRSISIPSQATGAQYVRISFKKGFAGKVTENSLTPSIMFYIAEETIASNGIVQKIGDLSSLKTDEKTNVVGAINEIVENVFGTTYSITKNHLSGGINYKLPFSAQIGATVSVKPYGTAFVQSQCLIYFHYAGDSANTNMGMVELGKETWFTLEHELTDIYVYATPANAQSGTVVLEAKITKLQDYVQKNAERINFLSGKKINYLGDSLTHGPGSNNNNSYTAFLASAYNCTVRNYGIIGSTVQYDEDRNPMCIRYTEMDNDADIVAFMGGTNDYWNNKPLGQFGDTTYDTFYGALDVLISGLIAKYPSAFVYAVTPPHGYGPNFTGETKTNAGSMQDIADAVKQVAAKYSIPVLDVFNAGGLYPKISEQASLFYNSEDGVHLTIAGQKRLARLHAEFIMSHYNTVIS